MTQSDIQRLAYQIEVTDPGTKNQGWHGTLHDLDGSVISVPVGWTVTNGGGRFINIAPKQDFDPFGMIHVDMVKWMETENGNVVMDSDSWAYRLSVAREGTRSEGWYGELLHGGNVIPVQEGPFEAPMGPFLWTEDPNLWGRHGWFHVSWNEKARD